MTILLLPLALALPVLNYTAAVPPPDEMLPPSLRGTFGRGGDAFGDGGEDGEGMDDAPPPERLVAERKTPTPMPASECDARDIVASER